MRLCLVTTKKLSYCDRGVLGPAEALFHVVFIPGFSKPKQILSEVLMVFEKYGKGGQGTMCWLSKFLQSDMCCLDSYA